jgi:hypothetical protein
MSKTIVTGKEGYTRELGKFGSHYYFFEFIKNQNIDIKDKTFLEIGCARQVDQRDDNYWNLFDSSGFFFKKSKEHKFEFISVDMDDTNTRMLKERIPEININNMKGEDFTENYKGKLDFVYLDAFDYEKDTHSDSRRERYRSILNTEITNQQCWDMHLTCCKNIIPKMDIGGLICFDDIFDKNTFAGKGKTAIPFLLENGFEIVLNLEVSGPPMMILQKVK